MARGCTPPRSSTWCDLPQIKTVTLERNKFGPSDWTDVDREFHSLEAFKKNELWNNAVRHDGSWTFITWRREWLLRSRKSLGARVAKNVRLFEVFELGTKQAEEVHTQGSLQWRRSMHFLSKQVSSLCYRLTIREARKWSIDIFYKTQNTTDSFTGYWQQPQKNLLRRVNES